MSFPWPIFPGLDQDLFPLWFSSFFGFDSKTVQRSAFCRVRRELSNEYVELFSCKMWLRYSGKRAPTSLLDNKAREPRSRLDSGTASKLSVCLSICLSDSRCHWFLMLIRYSFVRSLVLSHSIKLSPRWATSAYVSDCDVWLRCAVSCSSFVWLYMHPMN